jgi:AraC-like DNA-binding protein
MPIDLNLSHIATVLKNQWFERNLTFNGHSSLGMAVMRGKAPNFMTENTPYTVAEVAALTGLSERTITKMFEDEPGVLIYEVPSSKRKRASYRSIRIPRNVYERVIRRFSN